MYTSPITVLIEILVRTVVIDDNTNEEVRLLERYVDERRDIKL